MNDDKLRILKLLEEGKINAEEAYRLLKASEEKTTEGVKNLVIKVKDDDEKVNIRFPVSVIKASLKLGGGIMKILPDEAVKGLEAKNIDIQKLFEEFSESLPDKPTPIIEMETEDGEYVYIGFE